MWKRMRGRVSVEQVHVVRWWVVGHEGKGREAAGMYNSNSQGNEPRQRTGGK